MDLKIYQPEERLPITKTVIAEQTDQLIKAVEEGNKSALEVFAYSQYLSQVSADLKKKSMDMALQEIGRQNGKADIQGIALSQKEAGVKYDYSNTPLWVELNQKVETAKAELKQLESELRPLKASKDILIQGVIETVYPPIKTSTTTIETKFGK